MFTFTWSRRVVCTHCYMILFEYKHIVTWSVCVCVCVCVCTVSDGFVLDMFVKRTCIHCELILNFTQSLNNHSRIYFCS